MQMIGFAQYVIVASNETFGCVVCRLWVHPKCGDYTLSYTLSKDTDKSLFKCNNCKSSSVNNPESASGNNHEFSSADNAESSAADNAESSFTDNPESSCTGNRESTCIGNPESSCIGNPESSSADNPESTCKDVFQLLFGDEVVMEATLELPTAELVHGHPIPEGHSKFCVQKVVHNNWEEFDEDLHCSGAFLIWKSKDTKRRALRKCQ